jgi:hypothetical protein
MADSKPTRELNTGYFLANTFKGLRISAGLFAEMKKKTLKELCTMTEEKFAELEKLANIDNLDDIFALDFIQKLRSNPWEEIKKYHENQWRSVMACLASLCYEDSSNKEYYLTLMKQFIDGSIQISLGGGIIGTEVVGALFALAKLNGDIIPSSSIAKLKTFYTFGDISYNDILLQNENGGTEMNTIIKDYVKKIGMQRLEKERQQEAENARLKIIDARNAEAFAIRVKAIEKAAKTAEESDVKKAKEKDAEGKKEKRDKEEALLKVIEKNKNNKSAQLEYFALTEAKDGFNVVVKSRKKSKACTIDA